ncbi:hypothetical protein J6590_022260 [Homalodisca vitripennis]|nr:hypothetical protein J6590_022260 [Homalodisca vitripennis]
METKDTALNFIKLTTINHTTCTILNITSFVNLAAVIKQSTYSSGANGSSKMNLELSSFSPEGFRQISTEKQMFRDNIKFKLKSNGRRTLTVPEKSPFAHVNLSELNKFISDFLLKFDRLAICTTFTINVPDYSA